MSVIKAWLKDIIYGNKITVVVRIILAVVFLLSSISKIINPEIFAEVINRYNIVPQIFIPYVVIVLPVLECIIGILLIVGYKVKASAFLSCILLLFFIIFIVVNMVRGETFDCGCIDWSQYGIYFEERIGPMLLLRDVIYFVLSVVVFKAQRHLLSVQLLLVKTELSDI